MKQRLTSALLELPLIAALRRWKIVDGNSLLWFSPQGTSEEEIIKLTNDALFLSKSGTFYRI